MKNIDKIVDRIDNKQRANIIKYNALLQKELDKLINVNTRNGMVNATSFSRIVELRISDHINELIERLIEDITEEEKRLKFMFSTEGLEELAEITDEYLKTYISTNIKQAFIYALDHLSYNSDMYINTLLSNCDFKLKTRFEDMIFYNENTEQEVSGKEIKISNTLSYIAIILSVISIYLHFI